jgi:hypothetical protein
MTDQPPGPIGYARQRQAEWATAETGRERDETQAALALPHHPSHRPGSDPGSRRPCGNAVNAPYRIIVTGSRDAHDPRPVDIALHQRLAQLDPGRRLVIVHGACQDRRGRLCGVDAFADAWARRGQRAGYPIDIEQHPAEAHGPWPACGPRRNQHMINLGADETLAFIGPCTSSRCHRPRPHPSHGASGCADMAERAGIPTTRWTL